MVDVPYKYEIIGKKNNHTLFVKINGETLEIGQLIVVSDSHEVFDTTGMHYVEFKSDINRLREYAMFIVKDAPELYKEANLLEQQVSELIKNAIRHGNKNDPSKRVKVYYSFENKVKIIVEDEGEGFKDIDDWNRFNIARTIAIYKQDFENIMNFISWRGRNMNEMDGGNALFAAIEYWNGGIYYNEKGNKVCAIKYFPDNPEYERYK